MFLFGNEMQLNPPTQKKLSILVADLRIEVTYVKSGDDKCLIRSLASTDCRVKFVMFRRTPFCSVVYFCSLKAEFFLRTINGSLKCKNFPNFTQMI